MAVRGRTALSEPGNYLCFVRDAQGVLWFWTGTTFVVDRSLSRWWYRPHGGRAKEGDSDEAYVMAYAVFGDHESQIDGWTMFLTDRIGAGIWLWDWMIDNWVAVQVDPEAEVATLQ